jgi:hypothetical protein
MWLKLTLYLTLSMELRLMDIMVGVRSAALQWREPGGLQVPTVATNQ